MFQFVSTGNASADENGVWNILNIVLNLYSSFIFYINLCVNLVDIITKHEFKLEMSAGVYLSAGYICLLDISVCWIYLSAGVYR